MPEHVVTSEEVWDWPEYKAFAERLGVNHHLLRAVTVHLEVGCTADVTEQRFGEDTTAESIADVYGKQVTIKRQQVQALERIRDAVGAM